ncbi:MAG: GNAT family N-acetyltransferase, partial [bacterium]|nr:GNAT family N-acetyltransferase [bacterium]
MNTIHEQEYRITAGDPSYAEAAADLAFESGPEYNSQLFGKAFHRIISRLYRRKKSYYSYLHSLLALRDREAAGLLMYTDREILKKELSYTNFWINLYELPYLIRQWKSLVHSDKQLDMIKDGECYILYLCVLPGLRSSGIGTALIDHLHKISRAGNYTALSLDVNQE